MAFIINEVRLDKHNLAYVTLHETVANHNRVVHVVVPLTSRTKLTTEKQKKSQAKRLAKAVLEEAASAL